MGSTATLKGVSILGSNEYVNNFTFEHGLCEVFDWGENVGFLIVGELRWD